MHKLQLCNICKMFFFDTMGASIRYKQGLQLKKRPIQKIISVKVCVIRSTIYKAACCTLMVLFVAATTISCKKEHEQYSYTGIYSFSVTDTANGKTGIAYINTDSSTIEVNWLTAANRFIYY